MRTQLDLPDAAALLPNLPDHGLNRVLETFGEQLLPRRACAKILMQ